ncbi:unnamed protein product [Rotaria socialis]
MQNIELIVENLHISYETNSTTKLGHPFSFGITIHSIKLNDDLKSKIATASCRAKHFDMNYILYPTNMDVNMIIIITDGEHNFDRSTFNIDIKIRQLALNIDSTQFSDLLDFAKFQNYSTLYDRCREYRQLYLQESTDNTLLNQEQKERLKVNKISFCWFSLSCKIS